MRVAPNVSPKQWGPPAWRLLHTIGGCVRSVEDLDQARALFMSLAWLLPCSRCRDAYSDHLRIWPFPLAAKAVQRWVFDLHNHVNRRLGVPASAQPSWASVLAAARARPCSAGPDAPEAFFRALVTNHLGGYATTPMEFLDAHIHFWKAVAHFFPNHGIDGVAAAALKGSKPALRHALGLAKVAEESTTCAITCAVTK